MNEEKIRFRSEGLYIEGLLCVQEGERGAVVTHPHPLYGGSMYNDVVEALVRGYQCKGFSTLRFNFRGVGNSEGEYDQGYGEKKDVKSALLYMYDMGKKNLDLAGYSFGAWVIAQISETEPMINRIIMVSPPVSLLGFSFLPFNSKLKGVITGGKDDFAPADKIKPLISIWNPDARFEVIESADHFYSGKIETLNSVLSLLL
jgi:alpha/beta superfamily hydrolase